MEFFFPARIYSPVKKYKLHSAIYLVGCRFRRFLAAKFNKRTNDKRKKQIQLIINRKNLKVIKINENVFNLVGRTSPFF